MEEGKIMYCNVLHKVGAHFDIFDGCCFYYNYFILFYLAGMYVYTYICMYFTLWPHVHSAPFYLNTGLRTCENTCCILL